MQTMQPAIMLGPDRWEQDRIPADEFHRRLAELRLHMDRHGWKALLVYGDAREHAALAFISNFIPRMRWAMALVPRTGKLRLLCAVNPRDLPAMRATTWIMDVRSGLEWDKSFDPWFARFASLARIEIGTVGFDTMPAAMYRSVGRSLDPRFVMHRADAALGPAGKRPRELALTRNACKVLDAAARAVLASWRRNIEPETAALEGERTARMMAAQDVRTLVSLDGGRTLVPFQGKFAPAAGPLVVYLAVKVAGYWADMFVTAGVKQSPALHHAEAALDALVAAVWPHARVGDIHAKAMAALQPFALHPVLGGSVGHGIGLSLHESDEFREAGEATLHEDGVYSLQVGVADPASGLVLMSAIVRNTAKGAEVLACSPCIAP